MLVLLGLILSLALLEAGLRLGGFILQSIQEYGNLRSIKQKGAYRILCLGESTTQGQYPHLLEEVLNQRNIGVRFSVIDRGMPGTETSAILLQVESYLAKYRPDMVVAMMGINDQGKRVPFESATASKWTLFIRSLRIYKLISFLKLHLLTKAKEMELCKPSGDKPISVKTENLLPKTGLKETSADSISTAGSFKKAVRIISKDDNAYVKLGVLNREQGKLSQAEDFLKKAIELDPKNALAYAELGWLYRKRGEFSKAGDSFKKAMELSPENDYAYFLLGRTHREQGELAKAEDLFKKVIEINPKNDLAYVEFGRICESRGDFLQAENFYKKAIELNPQNDRARRLLGQLYREQGKLAQAEDSFKKAVEINSKNERGFGALASFYDEMGKSELAKKYDERANLLRSGDCPVITVNNYRKVKEILDKKGIKLVCVQYPMRSVDPLKRIFEKDKGIIFVDNEDVFKKAAKKSGYREYFKDMFAGDFGHCTQKGNELLAENIADVILREVFNR